jgi:crotonobetainyl-CoA:carnitine CoA-transferase CaiB-like acyl-CoA transferase
MDLRVLEVGDAGAAAYAGKLFARWGAEVIRVDRRARDPSDKVQPLEVFLHPGKRRVAIDYETAEGRDLLHELASVCDVVLLDLSADEVERLDWTELGTPGRIQARVSITPFGLDGPYRDWKATGGTLLALGGYTFLTGDPGRAPLTIPGHYVEYQSGHFAFIAAVAATLGHEADGPASSMELSMLECVATLSQFTTVMWTYGGVVRSRHGNRWENLHPNAMYRCGDGWYQVSGIGKFWEPFALMLGRPDLVEDARFLTPALRTEHADELDEIINGVLGRRPMQEILTEAQETWRIPIGIALSLADVLADPQLAAREFWRPVATAEGTVQMPGSPFTFVGESRPSEPALMAREEPEALRDALKADALAREAGS